MDENKARRVYADIIDLPHHRSEKRPHMSLHDRAAQFAPFAALSGYDAMVREEARLTQTRRERSEEEQALLNRRMHLLMDQIQQGQGPRVKILYFIPDLRKEGGSFQTVIGRVKRVDSTARRLVLCGENQVSAGAAFSFEEIERLELLPEEERPEPCGQARK